MKRSAQRILTTHGGSLPRPDDLVEIYRAKRSSGNYDDAGEACYNGPEHEVGRLEGVEPHWPA